MPHLSGFGLENFRVFKDYTWFDFAPITLLVGPNNSGKSSLIKALLLLKDEAEALTDANTAHCFKPESNGLYNINNAINESSKEKIFSILLPLNYSIGERIINLKAKLSFGISTLGDKFFSLKEFEIFSLDNTIIYNYEKGNFIFNYNSFTNIFGEIDLLDYRNYTGKAGLKNYLLFQHRAGIFERLYEDLGFNKDEALAVVNLLQLDDSKLIFPFLKSLHYSPSNKGPIERFFNDNGKSFYAELVATYCADPAPWKDFLIKKWLPVFGLGNEATISNTPNVPINTVSIDGKALVDLGFGVSQMLALLLFIYDVQVGFEIAPKADEIIILEEPEANLHPKLQSKIGDLLVDIQKNIGIQFIVETHSEYLIRKLQYLVAKGEAKPEDVVIYYFDDPDEEKRQGRPQVKKITIQEDGSLSDDFGPGFFDEAAHWELELLKLKRNKTRQN